MKIFITVISALPFVFAAVGDTCTHSLGTGKCASVSSCTTGFTVTGACPNDPADVKCCTQKACTTPSGSGTCQNTSTACSGSYIPGHCPGPSGIRCCVPASEPVPAPETQACTTPSGTGTCQNTSTACAGSYIPNYCPGPSTIRCCVAGAPSPPNPGSGTGAQVLALAKTQAGVPYSWGGGGCSGKALGIDSGASTVGFDCSGLTQYAVCQATGRSVVLPRTTRGQYAVGTRIPIDQREVGDLLYYATGGDCSCSNGFCPKMYHTAIWAGDGMMFEAQKTGVPVGLYKFRSANLCPFAIRHW